MKLIITESQYKRLINEEFPENIELTVGEKINKFIIRIFQWCHKNAVIDSKLKKTETIISSSHPVTILQDRIAKRFAIDWGSSLVIAWSFCLRYNSEGEYEQFLGEDLDFLGSFQVTTNVSVAATQHATVNGDFYVFATDYVDVVDKLSRNDYYDYELDYDTLHSEDYGYGADWEITSDGVEVDSFDNIEYMED